MTSTDLLNFKCLIIIMYSVSVTFLVDNAVVDCHHNPYPRGRSPATMWILFFAYIGEYRYWIEFAVITLVLLFFKAVMPASWGGEVDN